MTEPLQPYITEPGIYDIPVEDYHRDPVVGGSLSHSGSKKLLLPSCPAIFKAWRDGGTPEIKDAFDFGRAAHREVLGAGDEIVVVEGSGKDPNAWNTDKTKAAVEHVRAAGKTPVKPRDAEIVKAMAAELRRHPVASALLDPTAGKPEQTLVWRDPDSGVMCRALVDFLRDPASGLVYVLPDYKTAADVDPESIAKAIASFRYHGQGAWYGDGCEALGLCSGTPSFVLIFQRKEAPHLVVCAQVTPEDMGRGHERNRAARHLYRWCSENNRWPSYHDGFGRYADDSVLSIQLPAWEQLRHDGASERGEFEPHRQGVPA